MHDKGANAFVIAMLPIFVLLHFFFDVGFIGSFLWAGGIVVGIIACAFLIAGMVGYNDQKTAPHREEEFRASIAGRISPIVQRHISILVRKRRILLAENEYGLRNASKWQAEVRSFLKDVVDREVTVWPKDGYDDDRKKIFEDRLTWIANELIEKVVDAAQTVEDAEFRAKYEPSMSPIEYEHFCAERLRQRGWQASVTQASRDQGADVLARKGDISLVVQCKKYSSPVGNKAVQEVVAAASHYQASRGVVIATNGYTPAAIELARSNRTILLGHDDLVQLDRLLGLAPIPANEVKTIDAVPTVTATVEEQRADLAAWIAAKRAS